MNHTLSVLTEDKPGVLARVSSLLARRGFNIHSLAVGPSHEEGMSRMTIVVEAPELEQVKKQLHKLINVVKITELDPATALEREIMLVRVAAAAGRRKHGAHARARPARVALHAAAPPALGHGRGD